MAKRAKAPPGCYWRGATLWAKAMVGGRMSWWSLDTSDPAIAKKRREAGKARLLADAKHGDAKRSLEEAIVAWEGNLTRQVANGVLGQKTETRYLVSIKQLAPYLDGKALSDIDLRLLTEIVEAREQKGVTNATIKRDLVALSSLDELRPRQGVGRTESGPDQAAAGQGGQASDRTAPPRGYRSRAQPRAGHARAARAPRDGDRRKARRAGHLEARSDRSRAPAARHRRQGQ